MIELSTNQKTNKRHLRYTWSKVCGKDRVGMSYEGKILVLINVTSSIRISEQSQNSRLLGTPRDFVCQ